jgi:hypothetical protein
MNNTGMVHTDGMVEDSDLNYWRLKRKIMNKELRLWKKNSYE